MRFQGDLLGQGPLWGYVEGGMGQVSFAIAQAARDLGAQPPGAGGRDPARRRGAAGGRRADPGRRRLQRRPRRTLGLVDRQRFGAYRDRIDGWQVRSPVVKLNAALHRLPGIPAASGFRPTGR